MKIVEKIRAKVQNNFDTEAVTIAFLGDSVTQGCFETYADSNGGLVANLGFDKKSVYHARLAELLTIVFPTVPFNIINAGIGGSNAPHGLERLERDVLRHNPDLVVVCFGLNDCGAGKEGVSAYTDALSAIFEKLSDAGKEIIFMTPNMMNTSISPLLKDDSLKNIAEGTMNNQNSGLFDFYIEKAKEVCAKHNVAVCDCYAKWKKLYESGADITELLANKINHPIREMHNLFASSLLETILS